MRVLILHHAVGADSSPDDADVLEQVGWVADAVRELGLTSDVVPCDLDLQALLDRCGHDRPDVVFNLVECLGGSDRLAFLAPAMLETIGIAYTGSPARVLQDVAAKTAVKRRLRAAGIPTPDWVEADGSGEPSAVGQWIVKPVWEHASRGMGPDAVVSVAATAELVAILRRRQAETGTEHFAERFVDGREFNLSVLGGPDGPRVLPVAEIDFASYPPGMPRIVDYRAKWVADSFEYTNTVRRFPTDGVNTPLAEISLRTWRLLGLAGWARVDFRVDEQGQPWVLEVNANPCLAPDAGFVAAAHQAGLSSSQVVRSILADALGEGAPNATEPAPAGPKAPSLRLSSDALVIYEEPKTEDPERVRQLVADTGFFHSYEIPVAVELVEDRLAKGAASDYFLVFAEHEGRLAGYTCYGEIACTEGSYDLYWIAVHPDHQGRGLGRVLLRETEARIQARGGFRVYIETSGRPMYASTRGFYERCDYRLEATLEDFYAPGDAKVIYARAL